MSTTITQQILNGVMNSPEFKGFIEKPQIPNEAVSIFGRMQGENLMPIEADDFRKYSIIKPQKTLAGLTAKGATEFSTSGEQSLEMLEAGICKVGHQINYTEEDQAKIQQVMQRVGLNSSQISNYNIFTKYIDRKFNPITIFDSISNTFDLQGFFGANFTEKVRKQEGIATLDFSGSVRGVFNHDNVNNVVVENSGTGADDTERRKWKNKTIVQILKDLFNISNAIDKAIYQRPDTLVFSSDMYNFLNQENPNATNSLYKTYLAEIQARFPSVNIISSYRMNEFKNADGTNNIDGLGDRFVFFKKDPMYFGLVFSDVKLYPIEIKTGNTSIKGIATSGGFYSKMKEGFYIATGIN